MVAWPLLSVQAMLPWKSDKESEVQHCKFNIFCSGNKNQITSTECSVGFYLGYFGKKSKGNGVGKSSILYVVKTEK